MPTQKQATVDLLDEGRSLQGPGTGGTKGRNDASLSVSFPGSPIIGKDATITDEERHTTFQDLALDGKVLNGWCFDSFNRDYDENDPPSLSDVQTGPGGLPGSPRMPNPVSPGTSANPSDMGTPPDNLEEMAQHVSKPPFVGVGSELDPMVSSKRTSQTKLGDYLMGKSSDQLAGSDSRGLITPSE